VQQILPLHCRNNTLITVRLQAQIERKTGSKGQGKEAERFLWDQRSINNLEQTFQQYESANRRINYDKVSSYYCLPRCCVVTWFHNRRARGLDAANEAECVECKIASSAAAK
jgi:hypothetical protein